MNINDIVCITSYGSVYSSYSKMFEKFHFANKTLNHPLDMDHNRQFYIRNITPHEWDKSNILFGLQSIDNPIYQLVIRSTACKLIKKYVNSINKNIQIL
jgi:hypothetical protein